LSSADKCVNDVMLSIDKEFATSDARKRFRQAFPQLPTTEVLAGEYNGQVLDGKLGPTSCAVYLSSNFFSFSIIHPGGGRHSFAISYKDIVDVQRGFYSRTPTHHVVPQQQPSDRTDSLVIFHQDGGMHMFTTFRFFAKMVDAFFKLWNSARQQQSLQQSTQTNPQQPQQQQQLSQPPPSFSASPHPHVSDNAPPGFYLPSTQPPPQVVYSPPPLYYGGPPQPQQMGPPPVVYPPYPQQQQPIAYNPQPTNIYPPQVQSTNYSQLYPSPPA